MIEESANEGGDHVRDAIVYCFKHAANVILGEETVENGDAVGRVKVDVEFGGGGLSLNGDRVEAEVLNSEGVERRENVGTGRGLW